MTTDCIFCKIINKEIPAKIIYEDDKTLAFEDSNPQAPTHVLIIPKAHIPTLNDLEPKHNELIGHMTQVAKKIATDCSINESGYRIVTNCNAGAGQAVFHIHMHLLGGRQLHWPPG